MLFTLQNASSSFLRIKEIMKGLTTVTLHGKISLINAFKSLPEEHHTPGRLHLVEGGSTDCCHPTLVAVGSSRYANEALRNVLMPERKDQVFFLTTFGCQLFALGVGRGEGTGNAVISDSEKSIYNSGQQT